jgi:small basic protein (TIGR04137 family)
MTIDKSLKVKAGAIQNRNVLTRAERIARLKELDRWKEGDSVLGLPKVRVVKVSIKKKKKSAKAEEAAAAGGAAAGGAAPAKAPAAAAKAPAAAGAAKPAAGAAKGAAAKK